MNNELTNTAELIVSWLTEAFPQGSISSTGIVVLASISVLVLRFGNAFKKSTRKKPLILIDVFISVVSLLLYTPNILAVGIIFGAWALLGSNQKLRLGVLPSKVDNVVGLAGVGIYLYVLRADPNTVVKGTISFGVVAALMGLLWWSLPQKTKQSSLHRALELNATRKGRDPVRGFSPDHRAFMMDRTNKTCQYCAQPLVGGGALDHYIAHSHGVKAGGTTTVDNLILACHGCNMMKSALTPNNFAKKFKADQKCDPWLPTDDYFKKQAAAFKAYHAERRSAK